MIPSPMNPMVCAMTPPSGWLCGRKPARELDFVPRAPQTSNTTATRGSRRNAANTSAPRLEHADGCQLGWRALERVGRQDEQIRALTRFETASNVRDARGERSPERVGLESSRGRDALLGAREQGVLI